MESSDMTIDGVTPIEHVPRSTRSSKGEPVERSVPNDAIEFSEEARGRAEFERALEEVRKVPDIREDVVAEAKRKISNSEYLNEKTMDVVVDRIIDMLEI